MRPTPRRSSPPLRSSEQRRGDPGKAARLAIGAIGALVGLYGAVLLLTRQDPGQWLEVAIWFGGGVLAHDLVLSGLVIGACAVGSRLLPQPWRAPATIALVVWGTLTLATIPVLTRAGARADNPTLLDRPYAATWWTVSAIVVVLVAVAGLVRARRTGRAR